MRKILIIFIVLLPFMAISEPFSEDTLKHFVGVSYSGLSASGITYKYYLNQRTAFKIAGYAFYKLQTDGADNDEKGDIQYDLGVEFQSFLMKSRYARLYGLIGIKKMLLKSYPNDVYEPDLEMKDKYGIGVGVGIELSPQTKSSTFSPTLIIDIGEIFFNEEEVETWGSQKDSKSFVGFNFSGTIGIGIQF